MQLDDPCPNCGYRRQRTLMSIDPNAPGLIGLWRGKGDPVMQWIAKIGTFVLGFLLVFAIFLFLHI